MCWLTRRVFTEGSVRELQLPRGVHSASSQVHSFRISFEILLNSICHQRTLRESSRTYRESRVSLRIAQVNFGSTNRILDNKISRVAPSSGRSVVSPDPFSDSLRFFLRLFSIWRSQCTKKKYRTLFLQRSSFSSLDTFHKLLEIIQGSYLHRWGCWYWLTHRRKGSRPNAQVDNESEIINQAN